MGVFILGILCGLIIGVAAVIGAIFYLTMKDD
jgi:hypothetical protein